MVDNSMVVSVSVIGTGDYGRAFVERLTKRGISALMGSRFPSSPSDVRVKNLLDIGTRPIPIVSIKDAIVRSTILVLAVPSHSYTSTLKPFSDDLRDKILVDVSNTVSYVSKSKESNAEILQKTFPMSHVVKAFNLISAYEMSSSLSGKIDTVKAAGNTTGAIDTVSSLARNMGFECVTVGRLHVARELENVQHTHFPDWKMPLILTALIFIPSFIYVGYVAYWREGATYDYHQLSLYFLNKIICITGIHLLASAYLPGSISGCLQLFRGTKYKAFPFFLDYWLRLRKQLGILSFLLITVHVLMSYPVVTPAYFGSWYEKETLQIRNKARNETVITRLPVFGKMLWKAEMAISFGAVSFLLMLLLGLTSLPDVQRMLNWREWRTVQSYMGYACLVSGIWHVAFMGIETWIKIPIAQTFKGVKFLSIFLPSLVVMVRIIMAFPCIGIPLNRVRKGKKLACRTADTDTEMTTL